MPAGASAEHLQHARHAGVRAETLSEARLTCVGAGASRRRGTCCWAHLLHGRWAGLVPETLSLMPGLLCRFLFYFYVLTF